MRFMASIINRDKPVNRPTTRPDSEEKDDMERDSCMWRVLRGCQQTHCWLCECEIKRAWKEVSGPAKKRQVVLGFQILAYTGSAQAAAHREPRAKVVARLY